MTALLFVLAWATSGINGWFYVGNYGVPWFDKQPVIASIPVTTIFLALAIMTGLLAGWLHFRMDYAGHTEVANTRRNRVLASTPLLVVAVIMVVLEVGSMAKGAAQRYPVYTTAQGKRRRARVGAVEPELRHGRRRARRTRHQCRSAATRSGPALRPVRAARRGEPGRLHPQRRQRHPGTGRAGHRQPRHRELPGSPNEPNSGSAMRQEPAAATGPSASTVPTPSCRSASTPNVPR